MGVVSLAAHRSRHEAREVARDLAIHDAAMHLVRRRDPDLVRLVESRFGDALNAHVERATQPHAKGK